MARVHTAPKFLHFSLCFSVILCFLTSSVCANRELDEDNWRDILEGEWMVEFYAPWCPACNALAPAWRELSAQATRKELGMRAAAVDVTKSPGLSGRFVVTALPTIFQFVKTTLPGARRAMRSRRRGANYSAQATRKELGMRAAAVDVTKSPGLSGRFVVTALPTIFHVKDGEFRQYKGPRDADSMLGFVQQQRWKQTEPIPGWKAPNSLQMTLVAEFFKLSQALRSVHNTLMETYGLPTWGSYLIFAIATIFIGALLGLVLVCVIDLLYPVRRSDKVLVTRAELDRLAKGDQGKKPDDQELLNDDIVDDADNANSDAEKNSPSDSSGSEAAGAAAGDARREVRRRRARKAD